MPQRTLLITDFFAKRHPSSVPNTVHFDKPIKVIKVEDDQPKVRESDLDQCAPNPPLAITATCRDLLKERERAYSIFSSFSATAAAMSPAKSSIPSRIQFVRHHSAPLHHRSPVKVRDCLTEPQDVEDMRTRIHAFRRELYKYKSTYSRSPVKRSSIIGDPITSPFRHPSPQTPVKR